MPQLMLMLRRVTMWALAVLAAPPGLGAPPSDAVSPPSAEESQVVIKHTEPIHEVVLPHDGPYWSMAKTVGRVMDLMQSFGEKGPLFIQYSGDPGGRSPGRISVSVGFVASRPLKVPEPFAARERATELVASRFVQGLAGSVVQQYGPMRDWVASHGYRVLGPIVEMYEPLAPDDPPSRQRTEIRMPIQAVNAPSPEVSRKPAISRAESPESAISRVTDRGTAEVAPATASSDSHPDLPTSAGDSIVTGATLTSQTPPNPETASSTVPDAARPVEAQEAEPIAANNSAKDGAKVVITLKNIEVDEPAVEAADPQPAATREAISATGSDEPKAVGMAVDPNFPPEAGRRAAEPAPSPTGPAPDMATASADDTGEALIQELFRQAETRSDADQVWVGHLALRVQIIARHASATAANDRWSSLGRAAEQALKDFTPRFRTNPKAHAVVVFPAGDPAAGRKTALLRSMDQLLAARSQDAATLHLECVKLLKQAAELLAPSR